MTHPIRRFFIISACLLPLLSACKEITGVQTGYVGNRDDCRNRAQNRLSLYNQPDTYPMSDKERNNALIALFNECMKEYGWNLGGSKKDIKEPVPPPTTVPTQQPTTVVVVQQPPAAAVSGPIIVSNPAPAPAPAPVILPPPPPPPAPKAEALHLVKGHRKRNPPPAICKAPAGTLATTPQQVAPADPAQSQLDSILSKP